MKALRIKYYYWPQLLIDHCSLFIILNLNGLNDLNYELRYLFGLHYDFLIFSSFFSFTFCFSFKRSKIIISVFCFLFQFFFVFQRENYKNKNTLQ